MLRNRQVAVGVSMSNITLVDSQGIIRTVRCRQPNEYKAPFAKTALLAIWRMLNGADVMLGLSRGGLVSKEMVASMARNRSSSLANPTPEILPEEVLDVRQDAIIATGRSDYANR